MGAPAAGPSGTWVAAFATAGNGFEVLAGAGSRHTIESDGACTVLFDGLLHSRRDWLGDFSLPATTSDASLVLHAYKRWGEGVLDRVKGLFALVVWDSASELLLCARDPHGMHPFFYANAGDTLLLSPAAPTLARHPEVAGAVDRVALAEHLCHRWPTLEATYFEGVQRLAGGYALRVRSGRRTIWRYWDPIPPGRPIDYISDGEETRFADLFEQAIDRCLHAGRPAIYLSGGLDSVSVAAEAQAQLGNLGAAPLLGLSLVFEHPDANEETTQRAVAASLGLPLEIVAVAQAVGPNGLLADALEMSPSRSAPMMNLWNPAYAFLARHATGRGCEVILTGNGGDEWLEAGVHSARRALKHFDLVTMYRLWSAMQRSYPFSRGTVAANLFWTYGMRPILRETAAATLERVAPGVLARQERWRFEQTTPEWVAPDRELREEMLGRYQARKRVRSRGALDNAMVAFELEEFYESGRQLGVHLLHPFWDADLTAFLARVPPRLLMRGGYSKGLVRQTLAQKFPQLGFGRDRKVTASGFYRTLLVAEGVRAWKTMGGAQALAELGVIEPIALDRHMNELFRGAHAGSSAADPGLAYRIWYVLSIEAWLRGHGSRPIGESSKVSLIGRPVLLPRG